MNGKQMAILAIGLVIIIVMVLFPPWYDYQKSSDAKKYSIGYHFISSDPGRYALIDFWRLTGTAIAIAVVAALAILLLRPKDEHHASLGSVGRDS